MTGAKTLALVGEDTAHAVLLGALTRLSIAEAAREAGRDWIVEVLLYDPEFVGDVDLSDVIPGLRYTNSIRGTESVAEPPRIGGKVIKLRGHLGGQPLAPEAQKWRYLLVSLLARAPDAVLVAKDTDGHPRSLDGLRQVVEFFEALDPGCTIVIAAPHQDAECWLIAGIRTGNATCDAETVREIHGELGFDPLRHPERLTAHPNDAPTDAKRVLRRLLTPGDVRSAPFDRHELAEHHEKLLGDLATLRRHGDGTIGLAEFLEALRARVVTKFVPGT